MQKEKEFHLINRETLADIFKRNYRLSYMVLLLEYVCSLKKVEITLSAEEVCEVMRIKPEMLEEYRNKNWIKSWKSGKFIFYKAYDIVILAERINRRKVLHKLSKIPVFRRPVN